MDLTIIDQIVEKHGNNRADLIAILQDTQDQLNYLPSEALVHISNRLNVPLVDIYGICTFYKSFSLKPRGKNCVTVCVGTACHVRGAQRIADEFQRRLNVKPGETTEDKQITFETVNCLGCCALGPITVVNGEYQGHMNTKNAASILNSLKIKSGKRKKREK
jgi:NADH-quinone oxidoreductase subunit E